jgi:hypothetical protein
MFPAFSMLVLHISQLPNNLNCFCFFIFYLCIDVFTDDSNTSTANITVLMFS